MYRQTGRLSDRQVDVKHTNKQTDLQKYIQTNIHTYRQTDFQKYIQTNIHTYRQTDLQTDKANISDDIK